jgi:type II secretory pathway pseudopilin PulG
MRAAPGSRLRTGFSIVEALVAIAMMGVAGGFLAAAFTVSTVARRRAELDSRTAALVHERVASLARRSCALADTSGSSSAGASREWWTARRAESGWIFSESVVVAGVPPRAALTGAVPCR